MNRSLNIGIVLVFFFQVFIAANFGLAHDEAYYWLFSRNLSWGYFDHPPFVAAVIAAFSWLPHHELSVRIGFILLQAGTLFFLFRMLDKRAWSTALLLLFSFPLASYSGLLALPDMPLLFMTSVYFYFLREFLSGKKSSVPALGIAIALLLYAKYHGILLIFFTMLAIPRIVLRKEFWMIAAIALVLFAPHIWWQKEHDFATLRYHFLERPSSSFSFQRILDYVGTQLALTGLFCGPILWYLLAKRKPANEFERVLLFVSWGLLVFFLISTFSKKVEANWTISLAVPLILLFADADIWKKNWAKGVLLTSFAIVLLARVVFLFPLLPLKRVAEFHGWKTWAVSVAESCSGKDLVANSYQIASKLSFYLNREITSLNYRSRKNQFDFWPRNLQGEVCYITDKSVFSGKPTLTPEKKSLKIVTDFSWGELQAMKLDELRRKKDKP